MPEHVSELLGAYLDQELRGPTLHRVQKHLGTCQQCQAELDELRGLSALLRDAPAGEFLPTERFIANLTLNLPRQTRPPQPRKTLELGWWLLPAGIIGTWIFVQLTLTLSSLASLAADLGLFGNTLALFTAEGVTRQATWFSLLVSVVGSPAETLSLLNQVDVFIQQVAGQYIWQTALALIYLTWLGRWWLNQQAQEQNLHLS